MITLHMLDLAAVFDGATVHEDATVLDVVTA